MSEIFPYGVPFKSPQESKLCLVMQYCVKSTVKLKSTRTHINYSIRSVFLKNIAWNPLPFPLFLHDADRQKLKRESHEKGEGRKGEGG